MVDSHTLSAASLLYTFTLRPGLKFHDGSAVTAKDVVASVKRWEARDTMGQKLAEMTKATAADDDNTFTIQLNAPSASTVTTPASTGRTTPPIPPLHDA